LIEWTHLIEGQSLSWKQLKLRKQNVIKCTKKGERRFLMSAGQPASSSVFPSEPAGSCFLSPWTLFIVDVVDEGGSEQKSKTPKGPSTLAFFVSVSPSTIAPLPNCFLFFSGSITYHVRDHAKEAFGRRRRRGRRNRRKTRV
jgi:hypothetical protein